VTADTYKKVQHLPSWLVPVLGQKMPTILGAEGEVMALGILPLQFHPRLT
jgi:hypothetical protein